MKFLSHILLVIAVVGFLISKLLYLIAFVLGRVKNRSTPMFRFSRLKAQGHILAAAKLGMLSMNTFWIPNCEEELVWNRRALEADIEMLEALRELTPHFLAEFSHLLSEVAEHLQNRSSLLSSWSADKVEADTLYKLLWEENCNNFTVTQGRMLQFLNMKHPYKNVA